MIVVIDFPGCSVSRAMDTAISLPVRQLCRPYAFRIANPGALEFRRLTTHDYILLEAQPGTPCGMFDTWTPLHQSPMVMVGDYLRLAMNGPSVPLFFSGAAVLAEALPE